jgi:murein DD-endopeptidase MepM/ murein hydrolase activator NlpD
VPQNSRRWFQNRTTLVVSVLTLAGIGLVAPASADDGIKEARQKREDARNAQLQAARQINLLTAEDAEVAQAVADIEAAVLSQQAMVDDGRRRLADAQAQLVAREADLATASHELDVANAKVQSILIERYVGESDAPLLVLRSADAQEALRKEAALDFLHGSQTDAVNAFQAARSTRNRAVSDAQTALGETDRLRQALEAEMAELQGRLASQVTARSELQRRLATWRANQDQLDRDEVELTQLIQKRQLEALKVTDATAAAASLKGFIAPAKGPYGSGFGMRMHPIFKEVRLHAGVDIDAKMSDAVWAAKEGKTLYSGAMTGYGNVIILDHGNGVSTLYAHLSKILVNQGDTVKKGEVIGLVGATGWATGPHLHFEVRVGGVAKDPMLFLP